MSEITTTIGALVNAEKALSKLSTVKLDAKTRYHVLKLLHLVAAETKAHFREPLQEAYKEFGVEREPTPDERAQHGPDPIIEVKPEQLAAFRTRVKELSDVPVTVPWGPVKADMLDNYPDVTAADLLALGPLFELG